MAIKVFAAGKESLFAKAAEKIKVSTCCSNNGEAM